MTVSLTPDRLRQALLEAAEEAGLDLTERDVTRLAQAAATRLTPPRPEQVALAATFREPA